MQFNPLDEDVLLQKNTHAALVHPVEVEENFDNWNHQRDDVLCSVRKMTVNEPLPEALRKLCGDSVRSDQRGEETVVWSLEEALLCV